MLQRLDLIPRFSLVLAVAGDVDKDAVQQVETTAGRHQLLLVILNLLADTWAWSGIYTTPSVPVGSFYSYRLLDFWTKKPYPLAISGL